MGNLLGIVVHAANIHDTKSGILAAQKACKKYPSIQAFCADAGYRGTCIDEVKVTLHNSAARLAMSFPPSASCKFLDLPPVNLRNLHLHLTKNPFASRPPHLHGVTQNSCENKRADGRKFPVCPLSKRMGKKSGKIHASHAAGSRQVPLERKIGGGRRHHPV